jgi:hypothetical protein
VTNSDVLKNNKTLARAPPGLSSTFHTVIRLRV